MLLHKNTINALAQVTTSEDTRYSLGALKIEANGAAVATNGHVLLHAPASAAEAQDYPSQPEGLMQTIENIKVTVDGVIPIDVLTAAAKTIGRRTLLPILDHVVITPSTNGHPEGFRVTSADGRGVVSDALTSLPEKAFPEWMKVLPKGAVTLRVTLGQSVLLSLVKAAKALNGPRAGICLEFRQSPDSYASGDSPDYVNSIGVVMKSENTAGDVTGAVMPLRP